MHGDPEETAAPSKHAQILFCPYCRESFEGLAECPEHELALVPIDRLPRTNRSTHAASFFLDPRLGRGPVLAGALMTILGFFLPVARTGVFEASAIQVAIDGALNLWLVPGSALATLAVLWRRRDRESMWSGRFAVLGLAVAGFLPLLYTARRISLMASAEGAGLEWLSGGFVMAAGLVLTGVGSLRLGRPFRR